MQRTTRSTTRFSNLYFLSCRNVSPHEGQRSSSPCQSRVLRHLGQGREASSMSITGISSLIGKMSPHLGFSQASVSPARRRDDVHRLHAMMSRRSLGRFIVCRYRPRPSEMLRRYRRKPIESNKIWLITHELESLECGTWNLESGMWNLECGIWNVESGVQNRGERAPPQIPNLKSQIPNPYFHSTFSSFRRYRFRSKPPVNPPMRPPAA